jgi:hypothetical protein
LSSAFVRAWGPLAADERLLVRLYALLSAVDIAVYVVTAEDPDCLEEARPWGNDVRLLDLLDTHAQALQTAGRGPAPESARRGVRPPRCIRTSS